MRCVSRSRTSNSRCVCPGPNYVSQPKVSVLTSLLFCLFLFLPASFQYCCVPCATRPTVRGAITTRLSVSDYVHWLAFRYRACSSASVSVFASVLPQTVSPIHLNTLLLPLTSYHLLRLLSLSRSIFVPRMLNFQPDRSHALLLDMRVDETRANATRLRIPQAYRPWDVRPGLPSTQERHAAYLRDEGTFEKGDYC